MDISASSRVSWGRWAPLGGPQPMRPTRWSPSGCRFWVDVPRWSPRGGEALSSRALAYGMPQTAGRFVRHLQLEVSLPFLLYLPDDHARRDDWPLVVFLHGSGERGDDPDLVRKHGLARLLHEGLSLPAVVLSPQCPENHTWAQHHPALMALIDDVVERCGCFSVELSAECVEVAWCADPLVELFQIPTFVAGCGEGVAGR